MIDLIHKEINRERVGRDRLVMAVMIKDCIEPIMHDILKKTGCQNLISPLEML